MTPAAAPDPGVGGPRGALEGCVAIVTGAGQGLGAAIARALAAQGVMVVIAERNIDNGTAVAAGIAKAGGTAIAMECDVSVRADVSRVVHDTVLAYGGIDILVNNAHDLRDVNMPFLDTTEIHLMRNLRSGLLGAYHFLQEAHAALRERRGVVLNIAAAAGVRGGENYFSYAATKEGIRAMTRVVAREFGPDGIRVNALCPIALDTPAVIRHHQQRQTTAAEAEAVMIAASPLRRVVLADDVAALAVLMVGDGAAILTGHTVMADGGMNMDAGR